MDLSKELARHDEKTEDQAITRIVLEKTNRDQALEILNLKAKLETAEAMILSLKGDLTSEKKRHVDLEVKYDVLSDRFDKVKAQNKQLEQKNGELVNQLKASAAREAQLSERLAAAPAKPKPSEPSSTEPTTTKKET